MFNSIHPSSDQASAARRTPSVKPPAAFVATAVALAFHATDTANAQAAPEPASGIEEVLITGTRIVRDGYQSPTPLTVIGEEDLDLAAPANVADFVNTLPSVMGSTTPMTSGGSVSAGGAGLNAVNLRNLGVNRTLVLLDGQRSVPSAVSGAVDVNTFPQGLIKSVEVVTGGASAAYGSDAVSGVVNFILDKDFEGFKTSVQYGETARGDDPGRKGTLTAGTSFADDRGHVLFNAEITDRDGIYETRRDWNTHGWFMINNPAYTPTNGQPERLVTPNAGLSTATPGGIITNTALRGTYFGPGGSVGQLDYGQVRDPWMVGGDWEMVQVNHARALDPSEDRRSVFTRVSHAPADNFEVFAQLSWNEHSSLGNYNTQTNLGNVIIRTDNAFLPEAVRTEALALGITQFNLGTSNADLPITKTDNERQTARYVLGADGSFGEWLWDAYYQRGITDTTEMARDISNNQRMALAQDAVFHPTTGEIVCRSSIADPANGCVPFNRMGIGVNTPDAVAYVLGNPTREQEFGQDVVAVNFNTNAFENWAGTVSLATGLEYRTEEVSGVVEPQYRSGWYLGNYLPNFGEYDVKEMYVETLFPLASRLELNAAVRGTDYSTSGNVTTWKTGLTYSPFDSLTLRATRSRDIRAPNLAELFQSGSARTNIIIDPFNDNASTQFLERVSGNPDLTPEEADAFGVGFVVQPASLPGFALSLDYYEIDLDGAIGSVVAQNIVDRCFEGSTDYCAAITRGTAPDGAAVITEIRQSPFNYATQKARGFDLEASYRLSAFDGEVMLRALATRYLENYENNGIDPPVDTVGQNAGSNATGGGPPNYRYRLSATYQRNLLTVNVAGRGISDGVYNTTFIECAAGCPPSTVDHRTVNDNHIAGAFYLDAAVTYGFRLAGTSGEAFFSVENALDRDPAIVAGGPDGSVYSDVRTNRTMYDILGRRYQLGVRFNW
jgi:outer membrane receptor protein involved in Fe transport